MLKIRLKRVGRKHDTAYRVIVTPAGSSITSGKYTDQIGFYDPRINKKEIDADKAKKWLKNGAQPTDTVFNLLVDAGVINDRKKNVLPQKSPVGVEGESNGSEESAPVAETTSEVEVDKEATPDQSDDTAKADEDTDSSEEATEESDSKDEDK